MARTLAGQIEASNGTCRETLQLLSQIYRFQIFGLGERSRMVRRVAGGFEFHELSAGARGGAAHDAKKLACRHMGRTGACQQQPTGPQMSEGGDGEVSVGLEGRLTLRF